MKSYGPSKVGRTSAASPSSSVTLSVMPSFSKFALAWLIMTSKRSMVVTWPCGPTCCAIRLPEKPIAAPISNICFGLIWPSSIFRKTAVSCGMIGTPLSFAACSSSPNSPGKRFSLSRIKATSSFFTTGLSIISFNAILFFSLSDTLLSMATRLGRDPSLALIHLQQPLFGRALS